MTDLLGHEHPWAAWRAAMAGQRMHHAWLLAGREGLGKAAFALEAAAELVAEPGVPQPVPTLHPDIHVLVPLPANDDEARKMEDGRPYQKKRSIGVDVIRTIQRRLVTRPTLGARRAVIIDSADLLEKAAVNALLKSLEEPPQGTFFLLVAHQPGRLLPTVRSRCQVLRFHPLDDAALARALDRGAPGLDPATRAAAIAVAAGSPGAALHFAEQDLGEVFAVMQRLADQGDGDFSLRGRLADALGARPDRERQLAAIEAARMVLVEALARADDARRLRIADAHARMVTLAAQAPVYNYDPGLLVLEIGGLLASAARTRESASR
ncbi:DNA polymerase III subunit delta' [Novosphingobium huizhouense]|uniref:DNA polymerase III subunit delta' n=1 Tax=Novosphingobium huizhouense TaxID=2866625 RepID=UPI001CD907BD|nr:DNA polymerase III subunit delta' [Novosphingobium huizhouense]